MTTKGLGSNMSIMNGQRVKPEAKLVNLTDTFYSSDGSELFCVVDESVSNINGKRFFTCEEVESGRKIELHQDEIVSLMRAKHSDNKK